MGLKDIKFRSERSKISDFIYRNSSKIINWIYIIFVIFIIYKAKSLFYTPISIFEKNLGKITVLNISMWIMVMGIIVYALCLLIHYSHKLFNKKPNWWVWGTILGMMFLLFIGIQFTDSEIGTKEIKLYLNDNDVNLKRVGTIECTNFEKIIHVWKSVSCKIEPELKNTSSTVFFLLQNGTIEKVPMQNLSFVLPPDVVYLSLDVEGIDSEGKERSFSTGDTYTFLTKEEYQKSRKEFVTYILVLFGIILFSIPSLVVNFKKLSKQSKRK